MSKHKKKRLSKEEEQEVLDSMPSNRTMDPLDFKINCKFKTKKQKELFTTIMNSRITFVNGVAGTGKTLCALMAGLDCIKDPKVNINQIVLTKPIVEIASSRSIGALPGELNEKTFNYYTHFYDNLIKIVGSAATKNLKGSGIIKETILNFLRGSTFGTYDNSGNPVGSFCIFDEAQNSTIVEMKTFISRMQTETKLVIMGDSDQIDLKFAKGELSGLEDAIKRFQGIPGIGFVTFDEDDIVRDPFLIEIMKRYKSK